MDKEYEYILSKVLPTATELLSEYGALSLSTDEELRRAITEAARGVIVKRFKGKELDSPAEEFRY